MHSLTPAPRIAPLEPPFEPATAETLRKMMGLRDEPPPLALFRTMMTVPELGSRILPLGGFFLSKGALEPEHRELVIHRVTARLGAEYEWGVHARLFAFHMELDRGWLEATIDAPWDDPRWTGPEAAVLRATDELLATAAISDEAYAGLEEHFSAAQVLEFLMLAGWYVMISFVANGARVPLEPWAMRFGDVMEG